MEKEKIVVIEDEPDILKVIQYNLERGGYRVFAAADGQEGLDLIKREIPNLVTLDLVLPGLDGLEICRRLKADPATRSVQIIMITVRGDESDVVAGLDLGADDYVTKPFSPKALVARVKAVLRRGPLRETPDTMERIVRGPLVVDAARHEAQVDGKPMTLTATEFRLLKYLATHPGRVFTRDHLVGGAIGDGAVVIDRNIDVHVHAIRQKLGEHRDLIETIRGVGYRFHD